MQLIYFNRDRDFAQTPPPSTAPKSTHTLTYRGVSYELSMSSFMSQAGIADELTESLSQSLMYRGVQYAISPITTPKTVAIQKVQHLIYRGATYRINVA